MLGYVLTVFFACTSDCGAAGPIHCPNVSDLQPMRRCWGPMAVAERQSGSGCRDLPMQRHYGSGESLLSRHRILHLSHHQAHLGQRPLLILRAVAGFRRRWSRHRFSRLPLLLLLLLYRRQDHQTRHRCQVLLAPRGEISSLQTTHLQLSHAEQGFVSQFCVF